ncbi:MAG: hypothetical protein EOM88_01350 [Clostridia bacterium]|nr:hypothetical protein [Clostridia bacterium]
MKSRLIILAILFFLAIIVPIKTQAFEIEADFNPSLIISDAELMHYNSLSLSQIQLFLERHNSFLANYQTINAHGTIKTAAEIIYDAANNNYDCEKIILSDNPTEAEKQIKCRKITTVNPKFLLILLQKEQSLISEANPTTRQLDWATGYGCPDNWACNPYYQGFGKQINSASLQFLAYMQSPQKYNFKAGGTYSFTNPYGTISQERMTVTIANQATAALYNYTPHVFNGNYNVYKLYQRYFPTRNSHYPNGSLLQGRGEAGVWLIQNGEKRPFLSKSALVSRYDINKIIVVDPIELDAYAKGNPISLANYTLVQDPNGDIYLIVNDEKRKFSQPSLIKQFGFNPAEIINGSSQDLSYYKDGALLSNDSIYPTGALLQDPRNGGVFFVKDGKKAPIIDRIFLDTMFKNKKIIKASDEEIDKYEKISPILFDNGELLKSSAASTVYLIVDGKKQAFLRGDDFESLGYKWNNIITVSPQLLYLYPQGDPIKIALD